jgi:BrnA antitoxin of type II toxin-antitoxin system
MVREREIMKTSPSELADLPDDFWDEAELVVPVTKRAISLRVDEDVLQWFRGLGPRYQTRMNAVLRAYMTRTAMTRTATRTRRSRARPRRGAA